MFADDTPTEPLPRITTGVAPMLPLLIEEPEPPVEYVKAPHSSFLVPGIAAVVLFAFVPLRTS